MRISEIFYSVQGEGVLAGVPSVFVRTTGCNLRCAWCDTPYTSWQPEGEPYPVEQILEQVSASPARHVVLTGGEPMIAPQVVELTEGFRRLGLHITVETAGTVFAPVACDLMSISPKLSNSTPEGPWAARHDALRRRPEVLCRLLSSYEYQVKFVVARPEDLDEILCLLDEIRADRTKVVLMPEGVDSATLHERGRWIVEICKREGFRYSSRLHIDLWGSRRGV